MKNMIHKAGLFVLVCACMAGCSTGAKGPGPARIVADAPTGVTKPAPKTIYVSDVYIDPDIIKKESVLHRGGGGGGPLRGRLEQMRGDDPEAKAHKLVRALSDSIVKELKSAGYNAQALPNQSAVLRQDFIPANANLPKEGWLVGGWFTQVDEGNRAMQATVGFGAGAGHVEIQVVVSDLAVDPSKPFLFMGTESGKNIKPGGLVMMNPYAMAAKFVLSKGATEKDVKKQGAEIARGLIQYMTSGSK